ncbi:MAG: hypothetical protein K2O33_06200 [Muribaculaceae bacterium]|nr:hypothetical protein [Muribaculaceae bacterium]
MVISNHAIAEYYEQLETRADKVKFRTEILEGTGMGLPTFYYKIREGKWTKAELFVINHLMERRGYAGEN